MQDLIYVIHGRTLLFEVCVAILTLHPRTAEGSGSGFRVSGFGFSLNPKP